MIEWTIRFGDLLTICTFVFVFIVYTYKLGGFTEHNRIMQDDVEELKLAVRDVTKVLTQVAVQQTRLDGQSERMNILERRIEELQRTSLQSSFRPHGGIMP